MTSISSRSYYSIGDVLNTLQDEFPDISISKIRFLESQGLISPERTPSGYRKFYDGDIERLRFILREQKESFLPLKVIKERLSEAKPGTSKPARSPSERAETAESDRAAQNLFAPEENDASSMPREELAAAAGIPASRIDDLERAGFITSRTVGGVRYYDHEGIYIAKLAAAFLRQGIEPRHLSVYKNAAQREADMLEQFVGPKLNSRKKEQREDALSTLADLSELGEKLRSALARQQLRNLISE